jgi:TonB-dependent SusC/RagA subfamily outer membrane receptor
MKTKMFLMAVFSLSLFFDISAQKASSKITITGKVTDSNSMPVTGALIMIDGKTTSATTNNKGYYKIRVLSSASNIGVFTTITGVKEEPINGRTVVNFNLGNFFTQEPVTGSVESVKEVINEGYGTAKKSNISKPVTQSDVSGNEYASFSSIYEILKTIPGVRVSGNSVTVRGVSTTGSSSPLFVVDGVTRSSVSQIDPSTIKSIEVLKGTSASVYGLQGANGVILIRLKNGK